MRDSTVSSRCRCKTNSVQAALQRALERTETLSAHRGTAPRQLRGDQGASPSSQSDACAQARRLVLGGGGLTHVSGARGCAIDVVLHVDAATAVEGDAFTGKAISLLVGPAPP